MKSLSFLYNTISLLFFLFGLNVCYSQLPYPFGNWTSVKIPTDLPANPLEKPAGGNLTGDWKPILIEEFVPNPNFPRGIDEKKWNFGEFWDDGPCHPKGGCVPDPRNLKAIENPDLQGDGILQMKVISQKHDSCLDFAGGMGAELMTFSNKEDFRSYWLYPESYLEARVKQRFGFNVRLGFFLYPFWQPHLTEIDLCETFLDPAQNADTDGWSSNDNGIQDEYSNGYIWGESYKDPNFSCSKNKVQVKTLKGKPFEMGEKWLIWGLEWHEDKIRFYLNNVLEKEIDLTEMPTCNHAHNVMYYKPQPMGLRIQHANFTSPKSKIPDSAAMSIFIDYIRLYQLADNQVIQDIYIPKKICDRGNGGSDNISVRYYPDVIYEWSSPAFDFAPKDIATLSHCFCEMQWLQSKANLAWGTYPVYLKATLADGRVENHVWQVEFGHEPPSMPTNVVASPLGNSGYFQLEAEGDSNALSYVWSLDSVEWKGTSNNIWQPFSGGQTVDIWVKSQGICDWSQPYRQKVEIPLPPESAVFSENFNVSNPISGEKIIQEIAVYNMIGSLIRRRTVLLGDSWEGMLAGLVSGVYVVLYRDKTGEIVSLNKVYVLP